MEKPVKFVKLIKFITLLKPKHYNSSLSAAGAQAAVRSNFGGRLSHAYMEKTSDVARPAETAFLAKKNCRKIWPKNGLKSPKIAKIWPKNGLKWPKMA